MKKLNYLLIMCLMLVSCGTRLSDEEISENLDNYMGKNTAVETSATDDTVSETLEATIPEESETEVFEDYEDLTDADGILASGYTLSKNKFYFVTTQPAKDGMNSNKLITYYDFENKTSHCICPDPLCDHEQGGDCKYSGFQELYFSKNPNIFYSIYMYSEDPQICRINLLKDTVEVLHTTNTFFTYIIGLSEDQLLYYESEYVTVGRETQNFKHLYSLNVKTKEVTDLGYFPDAIAEDYVANLFIYQDTMFYVTANNELIKSDINFENPTTVFSMGYDDLRYWFYDTKTDELYFNINNKTELTGSVYVYRNGNVEKIELPHENIFTFTVTNSDIYYSTYEPVYYGISKGPGNPEVYDYSGGKVYKTNRYDTSSSEVVYDCAGEYVICSLVTNYYVLDNNLFFDEKEIKRETINGVDYTYFSSATNLKKMRVDLATGEMERICFD